MSKTTIAVEQVRVSLAEYLSSSGRWFLAIVVGLVLAAFGVIDIVLKAFNVDWVVPRWVWVASLLVSLTVSSFLVFHKTRLRRDQYKARLDELENAHPSISVEMQVSRDWLLLKVTNLGPEAATFSARVIDIIGVEMGEAAEFGFDLGWHLVPGEPQERELKKDEAGALEIAKSGGVALDHDVETAEIDFRAVSGKTVKTAHLAFEAECVCTVQVFAKPSLVKTETHSLSLSLKKRTGGEDPAWSVRTVK